MKRFTKIPILMLFIAMLMIACTDKNAYYERPSWLEPSVYEVLQKEARFTNYLKCVDRTLYASALKGNGLYTVFAPNDEAFAKYLASKGVSSVDNLSDTLVNKIVSYSIVYYKYEFSHLTDVLAGRWDTLASIKKKTAYYETIHQENYMGKNIWVYDMPSFAVGDNNYKYVPLYMSRVFEKSRTTAEAASDYSIFFSNPYTGSNVQNSSIVNKDLQSENGVVHEIDAVLEPLPNIEELLNDPDYSLFKSLINKTGSTGEAYFLTYALDKKATSYFQEAMPNQNINEVYLKSYTALPFNLNGERYAAGAESGGFTIFAPNNEAIMKFYNEKLKDYYPGGIQTVGKDILNYFINAQMIDDLVWPNDFKGSMNSLNEFLNGKGNRGEAFNKNNYSKIAPASNGFFYGGSNYIKSRYFETVFTEILLNPQYFLLNSAFIEYFESTLKEELLQCELNGYTQENYTVLLPSDELLKKEGFYWGWIAASNKYGFMHSQAGSSLGSFDVPTRIQRLVKSHIFKRLKNDEVNCAMTDFKTDPAFETAYGGYSYAVNQYGDMIRYKDGQIQMLGNFDANETVTATPYKTFTNGQIFKIDKLLQYSPQTLYPSAPEGYKSKDLYTYILNMTSGTQNTNVALFKNYLAACLKGDESNDLAGLSEDMTLTIFMPTNIAINKAISNGDLPKLTDVTSDVAARIKATKFVLYHMVKGKIFVDDGLPYIMPNREVIKEETWPTVLKDVVDNTYLSISKDDNGQLQISTENMATGKPLSAVIKTTTVKRGLKRSNYFGARAVMHEINDYMVYEKVQ